MKKLIAAMVLTAASNEVFADNAGAFSFMTAGQLLSACQSEEPFHYGSCLNYIAGTVDTFNMLMNLGTVTDDLYCLPANITQTRVRFVTVGYLENKPELLNYVAADQIVQALITSFPCNK